jgi:serine/threonine-protein kinase
VDAGEAFKEPLGNIGWRLSPDGTRIAFATNVDGNSDIYIKQLPDGAASRLTFSEDAFLPRWAPDGRSVTYPRSPSGIGKLWSMRTDGTGEPELVFDEFNPAEGFWSPDGKWLVVRRAASGVNSGARDILAIRPGVDSVAVPLVASPSFLEQGPALSRDGRWLAYSSNETGRHEIFVRPFPDVGSGRWQVSSGGGITPVWAHNGRELFYVDPTTRELKAAAFATTATTFQPSRPSTLFEIPRGVLFNQFGNQEMFDVAPGDQRFLMARRYGANSSAASTILVQGFLGEVKRLVPR